MRNESDQFELQRRRMVESQIALRGIRDPRVLEAMRKVPRHVFCGGNYDEAYADYPLQIGCGQTISQPYIVALMTELLRLAGQERVLEVGTGSGYQAAILCELASEVYSVERYPELAESSQRRLENLGYHNVHVHAGDGTLGWPEHAPYDRIIVTASSPRIPPSLTDQLADGGVLVIPVGGRAMQTLTVVTRKGEVLNEESSIPCTFVKLIGREGWEE